MGQGVLDGDTGAEGGPDEVAGANAGLSQGGVQVGHRIQGALRPGGGLTEPAQVQTQRVMARGQGRPDRIPHPPVGDPGVDTDYWDRAGWATALVRSEEHTSELQSRGHLVCRLLLEKKKRQPADS